MAFLIRFTCSIRIDAPKAGTTDDSFAYDSVGLFGAGSGGMVPVAIDRPPSLGLSARSRRKETKFGNSDFQYISNRDREEDLQRIK